MDASVIVFPGSNCDRDVKVALEAATGKPPAMVWHDEASLPKSDLIVLPGGFSYGDYLRCGAMARRTKIMPEVIKAAKAGTPVLGICNGFQILTECGLLPGALMRNANLLFICKTVGLTVATQASPFTKAYQKDQQIAVPVAHHDGNYFADADTLEKLEDEDRIAFRYTENPNGSARDIAGILSENRRVLGMMPHPERASEPAHGGTDGATLFQSIVETLA